MTANKAGRGLDDWKKTAMFFWEGGTPISSNVLFCPLLKAICFCFYSKVVKCKFVAKRNSVNLESVMLKCL